jgi:ferredoxin-NADP reductase/ferredoxin
MTHRILLTTQDGHQFDYDCALDQYLLDAAETASLILVAQCRNGSCGACHATVTDGDYRLDDHAPDALPANRTNSILMCRTLPRSDLQVALPYDHRKVLHESVPERMAQIVTLEDIAEATVRVVLRLDPDADDGGAAQFESGQFMEIKIPGSDAWRAYSLANTSNWDGALEFLIRLRPDGHFSTFLRESARVGDTLTVRGPLGAFCIRESSLRPRWFVAGGTGLAPVLSMLRRMAEYGENHDAKLFFGVEHERQLFLRDELEQLNAQLPQLATEICVARPTADWTGFRGTPVDALRAALARSDTKPDIYVCGPPGLVKAVATVAADLGVPADHIDSERFAAGPRVEEPESATVSN